MILRNREPVVIACAADSRYAKPLGVMLRSVLANLSAGRSATFYVLDGGIEPDLRMTIERMCAQRRGTVHWIRPPASPFAGVPLWGRMPVTTYYKLALAQLLPATVHRTIWLDCDLVVVGDLARLWDQDQAGYHVLAAQDMVVPLVSSACGVANHARLGIAGTAKYFNAGVLAIDLDLWRRDNVCERALAYLREYRDDVFFWDQEGLNAVLAGKWGELDPRWNVNVSVPNGVQHAARNGTNGSGEDAGPFIVHFAGNLKPWRYPGRDRFRLLYFHYLDQTPWAGWRPTPTLTGRAIAWYEQSRLRSAFYPAEQLGMRLIRAVSRRYVPDESGGRAVRAREPELTTPDTSPSRVRSVPANQGESR